MLGVKTYTQDYIDACRARVDAALAAYEKLPAATKTAAFEAGYFNNLVLNLDYFFVHRLRTVEGKDGNPMNEVRVLCSSMLENGNTMNADKSIKLLPAKSLLKLEVGDEIKLTEAQFRVLADAYFTAIETKFA